MNFDTFLKSISKIEHIPLPGHDSQFKMSPPYRNDLILEQEEAMKTAKKAGVMALFYPDVAQNTKLILILRKTYRGVHSAQVGFPGGKLEADDPSLEYAALRETFEEVGVPLGTITVLKEMTKLYIPPSNFTVHPFLGITMQTPRFLKQDDEVEDLIEVTFSDFLNDDHVTSQMIMTSLNKKVEVPVFKLNGHTVWGATAMMLSEIKDLLKTVL
ncbi:8-oxo-dGTP pyrophosphatase MutT (NUDIX family) [Gelidibacter algens]|uniref:8-oxo-dGTP pyrophosphatase MutT (NUDIX family) n=1 Tax=Gelidibacter algens TaxID=49280 RepID=A0A1A7R8Q0_9FLAO|nr:CoA pyrophosphatase [Gelidibacter algens]OBX27097.1 coenzyme A pyrophosphatase [Gelidibacter algens]RAJ27944.1 8-oxo-dGTP pyrophosphatase MutT (NUDIX family) [Gelidibacter algens]